MCCDIGEVTERLENEQSPPLYLDSEDSAQQWAMSTISQHWCIWAAIKNSRNVFFILPNFSMIELSSNICNKWFTSNNMHPMNLFSSRSPLPRNYFAYPMPKTAGLQLSNWNHYLCSYQSSRAHSPTFPSLHLCHSAFSNPSITSPTSQLILQPFHCFTYITDHSPTLLLLLLCHKLFT